MNMFNNYSRYYDLLYKDKDYKREACYIDRLIKRYNRYNDKSMLDIGCGTGQHDLWFVDKGYKVVGIDKSPEMIKIAKATIAAKGRSAEFHISDSSRFNLYKKFDIAVALFHVMSYQVTNRSFLMTLKNVYKHLGKKGLFIFDFWYGPAVLAQGPMVRTKNVQAQGVSVKRTAVPRINYKNNTVDVAFQIIVKKDKDGLREKIAELHPMRYFFLPELELMLDSVGFKAVSFFRWMSGNDAPDEKTWSGIVIAKK